MGIAHGLNLLFGWDLFTCVFLTAINAVFFPLFTTLLVSIIACSCLHYYFYDIVYNFVSSHFQDNCKEKFLCICIAGFILLSFVLGVIISQPEVPLSVNGMLTKLSGESAFALMSILGASIMPHNFYLHSSIVQVPLSSHMNFICLIFVAYACEHELDMSECMFSPMLYMLIIFWCVCSFGISLLIENFQLSLG